MFHAIELKTFIDQRRSLAVIDYVQYPLPFKIKRVFYIYNIDDFQLRSHVIIKQY